MEYRCNVIGFIYIEAQKNTTKFPTCDTAGFNKKFLSVCNDLMLSMMTVVDIGSSLTFLSIAIEIGISTKPRGDAHFKISLMRRSSDAVVSLLIFAPNDAQCNFAR